MQPRLKNSKVKNKQVESMRKLTEKSLTVKRWHLWLKTTVKQRRMKTATLETVKT